MELKDILRRIDERLKALGMSADAASKLAKKPDAIRNMRRAAEENSGRQGVSTATLATLAPVLETTFAWLATGQGEDKSTAPIVGYIGAGSVINPEFEQVPPEGLETVELPVTIQDGLVGFRVSGESMRPAYRDGDVILVWREQRMPTDAYVGEEVAVRTQDGRRFLKEIHGTGKRGVYNLFSHNDRLIEKVRIEWVGEIAHVVKASQLRRLIHQQRPAAARRTKVRERETHGIG